MTSFAPDPPPADRAARPGPPGEDHSVHSGHTGEDAAAGQHGHKAGHSWMMIACCIPMLAIAVALVATGVVGAGFLIVAVACTAIMALMMRGMGHGGRP